VYRNDRTAILVGGLASVLVVGLPVGLVVGLPVGLAGGLVVGLASGLVYSARGPFVVARLWLAVTGRAPLRLVGFLRDAHSRGVLRQAGAVWEFRHETVQRYLAERP
jgi:hypothetical protein